MNKYFYYIEIVLTKTLATVLSFIHQMPFVFFQVEIRKDAQDVEVLSLRLKKSYLKEFCSTRNVLHV